MNPDEAPLDRMVQDKQRSSDVPRGPHDPWARVADRFLENISVGLGDAFPWRESQGPLAGVE